MCMSITLSLKTRLMGLEQKKKKRKQYCRYFRGINNNSSIRKKLFLKCLCLAQLLLLLLLLFFLGGRKGNFGMLINLHKIKRKKEFYLGRDWQGYGSEGGEEGRSAY